MHNKTGILSLPRVLNVDVMCLNHDGNVIDAAVKASVAALRNLTLPAVVVEADEDNAVAEDVIKVDASDRSPLRLGGQVSQACVQVWQDGVFAIGYNFPSGEMVQ